jgi:hypothetical protein
MHETTEPSFRAAGAREAAADEIWATCTAWAELELNSAVLVHRGSDPLWTALEGRLRAGGVDIRRIELADEEQRWAPLLAVGERRADVLIHHDPFAGGVESEADETLADAQRALLTRFRRLVVVSYPHGVHDEALRERLCQRHLRALRFPHRALERRAHAVAVLVGRSQSLEVESELDGNTWSVDAPFAWRSDWTSLRDGPAVLQLPLGEVWVDLEHEHRSSSSGDAALTTRDGLAVTLAGGSARVPGLGQIPLCEIGIGVNPAAAALHATVLSEKADGTFHLGVGENLSLGGRTRGPDHRDLMPDERARLTARARGGSSFVVGNGGRPAAVVVGAATGVLQVLGAEEVLRAASAVADPANVIVTRVPAIPVAEYRDNVAALESLADPRLSEVVLIPWAGAPLLGVLGQGAMGLGEEAPVAALLELLTELLGPLPWHSIEVVAAPSPYADATSRPGIITIAPRLVGRPLELRWLYLAHELVHQWIGGALRLGPRHSQAWEDVVERLAHAACVRVLGPSSREPFQRLRSRQASPSPGVPDWTMWNWTQLRRGFAELRDVLTDSLRGSRRTEDLDPATLQLPVSPPATAGTTG